jgi:prophage maintenance system killer protein
MTQEKRTFQQVTSSAVCQTYVSLLANNFVSFPITQNSIERVDTLVSNINAEYFGNTVYVSPEEKAVAYLYFIIKDHPFTDGNKRTAVLAFLVVCNINNLRPKLNGISLDALAVYVEKTHESDHRKVIEAVADLLFPH